MSVFLEEYALERQFDQISKLGTRCLVLIGPHAAAKSGGLSELLSLLVSEDIQPVIYDKVRPNPTLWEVRDAAAFALTKEVEFVVAIGGGSVLDSAKVLAILLANPALCDEDLFACRWENKPLPFVLISTTAGSGSEMTPISVITNHEGKKQSINHPDLFATVSICDWRYTKTLSEEQTVSTALDALCHAIEGYFSVNDPTEVEADAVSAILTLSRWLGRLLESPLVYQTEPFRKEVYQASVKAGRVIAKNRTCFAHLGGYLLTEQLDVPHGFASALLLPSFLERQGEITPERSDRLMAEGVDLTALSSNVWQLLGQYLGQRELSLANFETESEICRFDEAGGLKNTPSPPTGAELADLLTEQLELLLME